MDIYKLNSLLQNRLEIKDVELKKDVKVIYDSIKIYIKDIIMKPSNNLVIILLNNRVSLDLYRESAKATVLEGANEIINLVYNNVAGNISNDSFNVNGIVITAKHSIVDPKRAQRSQVTKFKNIFEKLYNNSSSSKFSFILGGDTYSITNYTPNKINELPKLSESDRRETKADMIITTDSGDLYISLKGNIFRQWGGISQIISEQEANSFVEGVKTKHQQNSNQIYIRKVNSQDIINKSVYGKNYGQNFGRENVNYVIIGESISISPPNNTIKALRIYKNGASVDDVYAPYFRSHPDSGRNDQGILSTRLSVWPGKSSGAIEI